MDEKQKAFAKLLQHLIDHPEDRTPEFDREMQKIFLDPLFHQSLVERVRRDEEAPEVMNTLFAYARDPYPTPGRTFARKVLSEAWRDDDPIH